MEAIQNLKVDIPDRHITNNNPTSLTPKKEGLQAIQTLLKIMVIPITS